MFRRSWFAGAGRAAIKQRIQATQPKKEDLEFGGDSKATAPKQPTESKEAVNEAAKELKEAGKEATKEVEFIDLRALVARVDACDIHSMHVCAYTWADQYKKIGKVLSETQRISDGYFGLTMWMLEFSLRTTQVKLRQLGLVHPTKSLPKATLDMGMLNQIEEFGMFFAAGTYCDAHGNAIFSFTNGRTRRKEFYVKVTVAQLKELQALGFKQ